MSLSLNKTADYILLASIAVLPFSNAFVNILFGAFIFLMIVIKIKYKSTLKFNLITLLFSVLSIYLMINGLFQGTYAANKSLWKLMPLLFFGTLVLSNYKLNSGNVYKKVSLASSTLYILISLIKTGIFYKDNGYLPFGNGDEITSILSIHRPYLGLYLVLNIIFIIDFIQQNWKKNTKYFYCFLLLFFSIYLVLIVARLSVLTLIILGCIYILFYLRVSLKIKLISGALLIFSVTFLSLSNQNFKERIKPESIEYFMDYEPRFVIWKSVVNIYNNDDFNRILGYGNYSLIEDYLVMNYADQIENKSKRDFYISERFNTHSQYLDYLLFGGIIGITLFVIYSIVVLFINANFFTPTAITIAFLLFFLVENVFHRQFGIYLFLLYIVIFSHNIKWRSYPQ